MESSDFAQYEIIFQKLAMSLLVNILPLFLLSFTFILLLNLYLETCVLVLQLNDEIVCRQFSSLTVGTLVSR
jgi:hypothetical protein